jgi:SH3 domain-containing YSC84-like protein 1
MEKSAMPTSTTLRRISGHSSRVLVSAALVLGALGCSRSEQPPPLTPASAERTPQQQIVDASASALTQMRQNPRFAPMDAQLERARGVLIFPHLRKASLILGGGGGNGVLVARGADGNWSDPAFYSIGAPSVGLQIGYQDATVVLLIMDDETLRKVLHSDFTLGTNAGGGVGDPADPHGSSTGQVVARPIEQYAEAGGAFVGVSLDGYVTQTRSKHNDAYYGKALTPRQILLEGATHEARADGLRAALAPVRKSPQ